MIVAQRGDGIYLSDKIGVINLGEGTHSPTSVQAALKFGYWQPPDKSSPELSAAERYEKEAIAAENSA